MRPAGTFSDIQLSNSRISGRMDENSSGLILRLWRDNSPILQKLLTNLKICHKISFIRKQENQKRTRLFIVTNDCPVLFFIRLPEESIRPKKILKNQKVFVNSTCIIRRSMLQY